MIKNLLRTFQPYLYPKIDDRSYWLKMKMGSQMSKQVLFLWWFKMALQLCFLLGAYSENRSFVAPQSISDGTGYCYCNHMWYWFCWSCSWTTFSSVYFNKGMEQCLLGN